MNNLNIMNKLKSYLTKAFQNPGLIILLFLIPIYFISFSILHTKKVEDPVEIYFADRVTAAHKILIDKYNKQNEGKVKVIPLDFPNFDFSTNERKEVLARSLRGRGDGIDLFAVDVIWVQRFAKWCEPFDKYFSQEEISRIHPYVLESCYSDGALVAIPLDFVQGVLYYREDLIAKLPNSDKIINEINNNITWEEFIKLGKSIKSDNPFYTFPAADNEGLICIFVEQLLGIDKNYFKKHGFNFNTPEAEKALQLLVDLVNKYQLSPPEVVYYTEVPSYQNFIKNNGIFLWGWPSYDKDFLDSPIDTSIEKKLKKTAVPHFKDATPASTFGGWNLMISKFSNKKSEIVDFIKFLLREDSQELFYKESGYLPVLKKFYKEDGFKKKYPEFEQFTKIIESGVHRPAHSEYTKYSKIMSFHFERAIRNKISVKKALSDCTNAIQMEKLMLREFPKVK